MPAQEPSAATQQRTSAPAVERPAAVEPAEQRESFQLPDRERQAGDPRMSGRTAGSQDGGTA
jgi:hypothetical protein